MAHYDDVCPGDSSACPAGVGFRRARRSRRIASSSAFPRRDDNDGEGRTDEVRDANANAVVRVIPR